MSKPALTSNNTFARLNEEGLIEIVCENTGRILAIQHTYQDLFKEKSENLIEHTLDDGSKIMVEKTISLDMVRSLGHKTYAFSEIIANILCQKIAEGGSLTNICKDKNMPNFSTVSKWRRMNPDFDAAIKYAMQERAHAYHDKAIRIAESTESKDEATVNKLKVDTFKWAAEKGDPDQFGNRTKVVGDPTRPLNLVIDTGVPQPNDEREVEELGGTDGASTSTSDEVETDEVKGRSLG